ncbi:hypothetical protein [Blastococcus tunisiensis]|uniref:Tetratricopeptide repeat-containing protein n=1 Tax=Blastococcus tunisiensis TaxID=1798228 RepID=A0A1I2KPS3_9ACTN|nr:hypothetical protein [Blastococcus sp. DSM 46838]SFF66926.1 hypothetical protein SAMN05216574_12211 [Blastococcus sp. DSM 46838]
MARDRSVRKLLSQVEEMPFGFAKTAVAEEAVRVADAANDLDGSFAAREALASAAMHGGEPQKALVAVTWCLAQLDAHPDRFDRHGTYWALKWLPTTLVDLPDMPLEEIDRVIREAERRYAAIGEGADAIAKLRWVIPECTGRIAEAVEAHRAWRLLPRSEYSDCRACDVSGEISLALDAGRPERALDLARPLLAGRLECAEEPARALAKLLAPLRALGSDEEAERLHVWGLRLSRGNPSLVSTQSQHVLHLLRTGRLPEALDLVVELVDVCDRGLFDVMARLDAVSAAAAVLTAWDEAGAGELSRRPADRAGDAAALAAALAAEAREVAAAFDRRNGTEHVGRSVEERLATRPTAVVDPLPASPMSVVVPSPVRTAAAPFAAEPLPGADDPGEDDPVALLTRAREPRGSAAQRHEFAERALAAFERAGDRAGTARARRVVAEGLLRLDRVEEAAATFERAIEELAEDPHQLLLAALSRARVAVGRTGEPAGEEAQHFLAVVRAAAAADPAGDQARGRVLLLEAEWAVLACAEAEGELPPDDTVERFAEARRLLADDPEDVAQAWETEAWARSVAGDLTGARRAAEAAWRLATESGRDVDLRAAAEVLVPLLVAEEAHDRAIDVLAIAQRADEQLGDLGEAARSALARAELLVGSDRAEEGLAAAFAGIDLHLAAGERDCAAWGRLTAARIFRDLDRDQNAADLLDELLEQAAEDGDPELEGAVAHDLAMLNGEFGLLDEALTLAERAIRVFGTEHPGGRARAYRTLAQVHEARDELPQAVAAGVSCLSHLDEDEDLPFASEVRHEHGERLVRAGMAERSLELFDVAEAGYRTVGEDVAAAAVDLARADAFAALGRRDDALAAARRAFSVGAAEDAPGLRAEALWALAAHDEPDAQRYAVALTAYEDAGAPPEQLEQLAAQRDAALRRGRSRWRRR